MRFRRVAPIALTAVLVTGCTSDGGGPSGKPSGTVPPPTTSSIQSTLSSPTPSVATTGPNVRPGEKPPALPDLGKRDSTAGAAEFARYWFRTLDWAYATTDSTLARQAYAASCAGCNRFLKNVIDPVARLNEHFVGGRLVVSQVDAVPVDDHFGATQVFNVMADQDALKIVNSKRRVVEKTPATRNALFRVWLARRSASWIVVDWKQDSS